MFCAFEGEGLTPMIPSVPFGIPLLRDSSFQLSPPSVDFQSAEPSPPLSNEYGERRKRQVDAYRMRGLVGSKVRSTAPASRLTKRMRSHVLPPSLLRYTPRVSLGPKAWPMAAT